MVLNFAKIVSKNFSKLINSFFLKCENLTKFLKYILKDKGSINDNHLINTNFCLWLLQKTPSKIGLKTLNLYFSKLRVFVIIFAKRINDFQQFKRIFGLEHVKLNSSWITGYFSQILISKNFYKHFFKF